MGLPVAHVLQKGVPRKLLRPKEGKSKRRMEKIGKFECS